MGNLSHSFSAHEFRCKDGSEHPVDPELIRMLEAIREHFGSPVTIVSGYRSPSWNIKVGGASRSYHLQGKAADIKVSGVHPEDVYAWADHRFPQSGIGLYRSWVHIDSRGYRARWGAKASQFAVRSFALAGDGAVTSTKWAIARALAEIAAIWAWRALRDWRVSPEELLDLADDLLRYARERKREAGDAK